MHIGLVGLGLFLAIVFNDARMKGRKFYRTIIILPYAFPGFLSGLVWLGLFNQDFGFINNVLLFGAEVNAELERGRQIEAGQPAEEEIKLPYRKAPKDA